MEERRRVRKFDTSLFLACLVGAALGYVLAEVLYNGLMLDWLPVLRTGFYFAVVVLFVCLAGLLCEMVTGNLRSGSWTGKNIGIGFLMTFLAAVVFFLLGMLFQFLYGLGLNIRTAGNVQDYIVLIDNSGSTYDTDPNEERFSSVVSLVQGLDNTHSIMAKVFDETVLGTFPMTPAGPDTVNSLQSFFGQYDSNGGTDLQNVLMETVNEYTPTGRDTAVVLLSDGISNVDYDAIAAEYTAKNLPIFCVSFADSDREGRGVLTDIADQTNGYFYEIEELSNLSQTVETMIKLANRRQLLDPRRGLDLQNNLARVLRVVFVTVLGVLVAVAVGLAVDSSTVMTSGMPVHAVGALLAGLLAEFGWSLLSGSLIRLLMSLLISLICVCYIREYSAVDAEGGAAERPGRKKPSADLGIGDPNDLRKKKRDSGDPKSLV